MNDTRATVDHDKYCILVIGKTGNGKSSLCNMILGRDSFDTGRSMSSTTVRAQVDTVRRHRDGVDIKVVDTPDITNLEMSDVDRKREVAEWRRLTSEGRDVGIAPQPPSAVLLAVRCDVRYTAEEYAVYQKVKRLWGDNSLTKRLVVAFTFGDRQDKDIGQELLVVCQELKNVLEDAGGRYVVFNDKASNKEQQVEELLSVVHKMQTDADDPWYIRLLRILSKAIPVLVYLLCLCITSVLSVTTRAFKWAVRTVASCFEAVMNWFG